jgi:high-affinity K+ transport system ATPase subunit B
MITGDSKETAVAVGKELDLFAEHKRTDKSQTPTMKAFDGRDFFSKEPIDQVNLLNAGNIVFSRTEPNDKKRIIEILQSLGEIPAMTGDGVNDGTYYAFLCNVHVRLNLRVKEIMNSPCPSTGFYWHSNGLRDRCC